MYASSSGREYQDGRAENQAWNTQREPRLARFQTATKLDWKQQNTAPHGEIPPASSPLERFQYAQATRADLYEKPALKRYHGTKDGEH